MPARQPSPHYALRLFLLLLLVAGSGCATVDFDADKPASYALEDTTDTYLGRYLAPYVDGRTPGHSGFHVITDSIDALAVRLLMVKRAERTIDAQYYMIADDIIGEVFFAAMLSAADRGVKVRLLIDDINTGGTEPILAALSDHPNIQLRIFNPFASRNFRAFDAWDFERVNRRMHNKSFTVDNQMTLIGGRNIAREYFAANLDYNFGDLDTLAIGPVVRETSAMFDSYWNHRQAVPYTQLSGQQPDSGERLGAVRADMRETADILRDTIYAKAVKSSFDDYVATTGDVFAWAPYQLVYDSPDKALGEEEAGRAFSIVTPLADYLLGAEREILVVSPYFVPLDSGIGAITEMQEKGVQVDIVTNSLASSDHLLVHGGYAPSRKPLLQAGVRFFEVRGDLHILGTEEVGTHHAKSSLHTKAFIVDRRFFFMGSFNWDPRSARLNTELGIVIDSPAIAGPLAEKVYQEVPAKAYEVFLSEEGNLRWREETYGEVQVFDHEPDTSWFTRFSANLSRLLPVKEQL